METTYIEEIIGEHNHCGENAYIVARPGWTVEIVAGNRIVLSAKRTSLNDALKRLEQQAKEIILGDDDS